MSTLFADWKETFGELMRETRAALEYGNSLCFKEAVDSVRDRLSDLSQQEATLYVQLEGDDRVHADEAHAWAEHEGTLPSMVR